uniref:Uncharacterized protein n=1 Tax=Cyanophora biloba TaxID=1489483 RepID=A0A2Z4HH06_9EUKA|nr:hypothetical protein [Cyanophora biloba]AWW13821.1 hypothetical protein [Cyanophora biloba]
MNKSKIYNQFLILKTKLSIFKKKLKTFIFKIKLINLKRKLWNKNILSMLQTTFLPKKEIIKLCKLLIRFTTISVCILFITDLVSRYIAVPLLKKLIQFIFVILNFLFELFLQLINFIYTISYILYFFLDFSFEILLKILLMFINSFFNGLKYLFYKFSDLVLIIFFYLKNLKK